MNGKKYVLSSYVRFVHDNISGQVMVFHSLFGNPRVVNGEGLRFLNLFKQPMAIKEISELCDEDSMDTIREFTKIFFLVEPDFNERKFLEDKKEQQLALIQKQQTIDRIGLAISDLCNFGCAHCIHFQSTINSTQPAQTYKQMILQSKMSWETARRCVDKYVELLKKQGKTHGKIHFGNAEPLINWSVIEQVLEYCAKIDSFSFDFAINTNLTLMTKKMGEILKKYRVRIATSLDGGQIANDIVRVTKSGQGTFARIIEKFNLLTKIKYPLDGFSITVTSRNFNFIDNKVIDLAIERKMTSIAFDYDLVGLVHVPIENRVEKLIRLKRYANKYGIDFFGTWDSPFRNLTSETFLSDDQAFCAAVQGKSLEFNVDGSIKICSHTTTSIGYLNDFNNLFEKDSGLLQIVASRYPGTDKYCFNCEIEGPCGGQCHVTREVVIQSVNKKQLFTDMCNFYRSVTKALALEYIQSSENATITKRQKLYKRKGGG